MIIGIDLGTTNSEVSILREGKLQIVATGGSALMPSCVGLDPEGKLVVGQEARNQYALRPADTIRSIKRKMGTGESIRLGTETYTPSEISAIILRELKTRAERALNQPVSKAVITVPAYFNDAQRQATREAGELAGLEVLRILNEPTAAALAYEAAGVRKARNVMVYDFGGGTFDVSIVTMTGDVVEVRASHGDNQLGGDDIDALLFEYALARLREEQDQPLAEIGESRLKMACEQLKKDLSFQAAATLTEIALPMADGGTAEFSLEMNRAELESLAADLLRKTLTSIRHVMTESGLDAGQIDEILLVGGTTRIPAIAELIERELGKSPRRDVDPDLAVAYGAGVMAARLAGAGDQRILVDISPYTFGTSCLGDLNGEYCPHLFVPIIKSGTPLPAKRGKVFYTMANGQEVVDVRIFQGDSQDARQNVLVGDFLVEELDDEAPGGSAILLNMKLDLDGILTVTAVEQHTGLNKTVVLEDTLRKLSREDLATSRERIADLFPEAAPPDVFDDEQDGNDSATEENPADAALLERVDQAREKLDSVDREDIEKHIARLKDATAAGHAEEVDQARESIEDILFFAEQRG